MESVNDSSQLECLDAHLKTIQLTLYNGKTSDVNLIRFFLLNARVLESMKVVVGHVPDDNWIASEHEKLQLEVRASPGARFAFKHNNCWPSEFAPPKHIHNLALDDPFDRSIAM